MNIEIVVLETRSSGLFVSLQMKAREFIINNNCWLNMKNSEKASVANNEKQTYIKPAVKMLIIEEESSILDVSGQTGTSDYETTDDTKWNN